MKRHILLALFAVLSLAGMSQERLENVSGVVIDRETRKALRQVNVAIDGSNISTVTNDEGRFVLKCAKMPKRIVVTHIGYKSRYVEVPKDGSTMRIMLTPSSVMLSEVLIMPEDPEEVLMVAIKRIVDNYGRSPQLFQTFYRETVQKRQNYIYIAEAVSELMKTGYHHTSPVRDWVAILKARRLVSTKQSDTLGVKIQGGPLLMNQLDFVKSRTLIMNIEELKHYNFSMKVPEKIEDRLQLVIEFHPKGTSPDVLYHGKVYIDNETYTVTRAELTLDMGNRDAATQIMLVKKPLGLRFRPRELSLTLNFKREGAFSRINYLRTQMRFSCDWKRRLFSTNFTAVTEMVVTDKLSEVHGKPSDGRFKSYDSFYDKVDYFDDPNFWADYNIIEPSESLENAVKRLRKR